MDNKGKILYVADACVTRDYGSTELKLLVYFDAFLPRYSRAVLVFDRTKVLKNTDEVHGVCGASLGCMMTAELKAWVEISVPTGLCSLQQGSEIEGDAEMVQPV